MLCVKYLHIQGSIACSHRYRHLKYRSKGLLNTPSVLRWTRALIFGYRYTVCVGVGVEAGDAEVDVIYISFIVGIQYIGYLVPYEHKVQMDN